jgi:hypothetical protein
MPIAALQSQHHLCIQPEIHPPLKELKLQSSMKIFWNLNGMALF